MIAANAFHQQLKRVLGSMLICAAAASFTSTAGQSDKEQTLTRAGQAYYNLKQSGLIEFRANLKPNWQMLAGSQSSPESLKTLEGIRFSIWIDPQSRFFLDHETDLLPASDKASEYYDRVFKDMDSAVSRFISTWSVFVLTSPFPRSASDYQLTQVGEQYQFSNREGANTVLTIADGDFKITEIKVTSAGFKASLKPMLEKTPKGFILTGYTASYQTDSRITRVEARLEYQEVNGLQLLRKVNMNTVYEGKPAQIEWLFADYRVKVR